VNAFLAAAIVLLACSAAALPLVVRGSRMDAVVGMQLAGVLATLVLLLIAEGMSRPALFDLGLVAAFLSMGGGLIFVRTLERWL
jgi:multisubunit Na+/H+ antiporter MnhF subunit